MNIYQQILQKIEEDYKNNPIRTCEMCGKKYDSKGILPEHMQFDISQEKGFDLCPNCYEKYEDNYHKAQDLWQ